MPSDEVCAGYVILFLLVMYLIANIQSKTLLNFISKNNPCIKKSKVHLRLPLYAPISKEHEVNFT